MKAGDVLVEHRSARLSDALSTRRRRSWPTRRPPRPPRARGVPIAQVETTVRRQHGVRRRAAGARPASPAAEREIAGRAGEPRRGAGAPAREGSDGDRSRRATSSGCAVWSRKTRSRSSSSTPPSPRPMPPGPPPTPRNPTSRPRRAAITVAQQRAAQARGAAAQAQRGPGQRADRAAAAAGHPGARRCRRRPRAQQAQAALAQAELNLHTPPSRRRPTASSAGRRSRSVRSCRPGQPLLRARRISTTSGSPPTSRKPSSRTMRPGSKAEIDVDALGGSRSTGHVDSISGRDRRQVQPAAARERDRQLRQGRAARAGQDRPRPGPGSRPSAAPGHVGDADGAT